MKGHFLISLFLLLIVHENLAQNDLQLFPVGSDNLLSFPRKWQASNDDLKFTSQLNEVKLFYRELSQNKNAVLPSFPTLMQFEVGDKGDSLFCFCSDSLKNDSCFKLPNMGLFECYFVSSTLYENQFCNEHFPENKFSKFGNLILFNRQEQIGECYTIYYETKGDNNNSFRFFRIPDEKKIEIYECNSKKGTYILYNRFTIAVLNKGRTSFRENP